MEFFKDRRIVLAVGAGVALLLGILIAVTVMRGSRAPAEPPPASQGGLVVETGRDDDTKLDPTRPIRCFVAGQFAGEITLTECAQRNGVATGALDVGVDETGALAAADSGTTPSDSASKAVDSSLNNESLSTSDSELMLAADRAADFSDSSGGVSLKPPRKRV
jgi:hypothetical protein